MQTTREDQGRTNEFDSALISLSRAHALLSIACWMYSNIGKCIYEIKIEIPLVMILKILYLTVRMPIVMYFIKCWRTSLCFASYFNIT